MKNSVEVFSGLDARTRASKLHGFEAQAELIGRIEKLVIIHPANPEEMWFEFKASDERGVEVYRRVVRIL